MVKEEFSNFHWILTCDPLIDDELKGESKLIQTGDIIVLMEGFDFIVVESNRKVDIIKQLAEAYHKLYREDSTRTKEFDKNTDDPFEKKFVVDLKDKIHQEIDLFTEYYQPAIIKSLQDEGVSIAKLLGDQVYFEGFYPYSIPKYQNKNVWMISKGS